MRQAGKITATIEILSDFEQRRVPLKTAIADWGRANRYAGAKDRAWISGLALDVLRRRSALSKLMDDDSVRASVIAALGRIWSIPIGDLEEALAEEPHGAGAMSDKERSHITSAHMLDSGSDVPEWIIPMVERAFGADTGVEMDALCQRADIDLRINGLKTDVERALKAVKPIDGRAAPFVSNAARIEAPDPSVRAPSVTVIPAFNKGWVEVQDLGSQLASAAAGSIKGKQVLDFCAGGGGKSLALAAMMENTGQLHAFDISAHRLKPLYARAKRAGLRNLQIHTPDAAHQTAALVMGALTEKMDVVFVDAPCTGAGTWRRHPDTKWRLTERQLEQRMGEQDKVLQTAKEFVRPGGILVYVTCSFFMEENEDRTSAFCAENSAFTPVSPTDQIIASGLLQSKEDAEFLRGFETKTHHLRLTPHRSRTDGFCISVFQRG